MGNHWREQYARVVVRSNAMCGGDPSVHPRLAIAMLGALVGVLTGCGEGARAPNGIAATTTGAVGPSAATGTTGAPTACLSALADDGSLNLLVDIANNYAFDSTVTLNVLPVAPNTPLDFDWSGLTIDIQKQPIDPASEVVTVLVSVLELSLQEFQDKLNANENLASYSSGALAFYPTTETSANIYQFGVLGVGEPRPPAEIDPYFDPEGFPPDEYTYALLVQDTTEAAHGVRMVQALQLDPNSLTTEVAVTNDSSHLSYHTDLTTLVPVQVPAGTANITVDWTHLQEVALNGLGDAWKERSVDEVMVSHYSLTPAELTEQFLGLEKIADQLYRGPVAAGAKINLSTLVEETSGAAFTGIDVSGTWVLALNCSNCTNPAPWFLTILQACP